MAQLSDNVQCGQTSYCKGWRRFMMPAVKHPDAYCFFAIG
jgi:hypothetical protein